MPRINLADGRWLTMRVPTVNEHLMIADLEQAKDPTAKVERLRFWRDTFRAATLETSWGGDVGDMPIDQMFQIITPWLRAAEDDAVPPVSGSSSGTPQAEPRSRAPMARKQRSAGRRSSRS